MNTKLVKANIPGENPKSIEIPSLCPICEVSNNPVNSSKGVDTYKSPKKIAMFSHKCTDCYKLFYTLQLIDGSKGELLAQYPSNQNRKFDELFLNVSPRFVNLYNQAEEAEEKGHIDIAGMGYRAAMEVLIKDYALVFKIDAKENIAKQNLNNAIGKYLKDRGVTVPADVVRKLGNDYAHWDKDYSDFSLNVLKEYLDILLLQILAQLKIENPPIEVNRSGAK